MTRKSLENSKIVLEISKKPLEKLTILVPRESGEKRDAWFWRAGRVLGIPARRLKSLYYDPRCKMWATELEAIQKKQGVLLHQQLAELRARQDVVAARLKALGEYHEENMQIGADGAGLATTHRCLRAHAGSYQTT